MENQSKIATNTANGLKDVTKVTKQESYTNNNNGADEKCGEDKDPYDIMVELAAAYGEDNGWESKK